MQQETLLQREDRSCDGCGIVVRRAPSVVRTLISEGEHAASNKAVGIVADLSGRNPGLLAARGHGLPKQHDRTDHFVVMLPRISEIEFELGKFLRRGHRTRAPEQPLDGAR